MSVTSILVDEDGVIVSETAVSAVVTVPASDLMMAVGATHRHRLKADKDMPFMALNCLFVALDTTRDIERVVVGATNQFTAVLATTDSRDAEGERFFCPDDPSEVWKLMALPPGLFSHAATAGVFDADRSPVRDIDRLAEGDPEADIVLELSCWHLRVAGPAGHLNWPRINPPATLLDHDADTSTIPDLPRLIADHESQLPGQPQRHDIRYSTALLRLMEDLSGPKGQLRFVQPSSGSLTLVTARDAPTPRIAAIGPIRESIAAEDHV